MQRGMTDVLRSELLARAGFAHGFSLRTGGMSEGPFASANLGRRVGDAPERVRDNHVLFARAVGFEPDRLYEVSQVHGRTVRVVGPGETPEQVRGEEADALVATADGIAVGVRVADCIPLLLADRRSGAVAAVHAGWRGCEARIVDAALAQLAETAGTRPGDVLAALGPHIRAGSFEVGEDVAERIAAVAGGQDVVRRGGERPHVDLTRVVRAQLAARGVDEARVDDVGGCTYSEPDRFFSYRRDGARSGRHLGAIVARGGG